MKKLLAVVAIILAAVIFFFALRASIDDVDGLAGEPWTVVAIEDNGREVPAERFEGLQAQFAKDSITWVVPARDHDDKLPGTCSIDPSKRPKEIDLTILGEKEVSKGIYEIKDNTLVICVGEPRPKVFSSKAKQMIWVLKR